MNDGTNAHDFSEHHQRHVRTTFQYIDKLLLEAEHTMADAGSPSPFRRHSDDTTPIQRKVTHDYIVRIREAMRRVMEELDIAPPEPHSGAVWAAAINLMYLLNLANELTPERMRAYGPLRYAGRRQIGPYPCRTRWIGGKVARFPRQRRWRRSTTAASAIRKRRVTRFGCSAKSKGSSPRMVS